MSSCEGVGGGVGGHPGHGHGHGGGSVAGDLFRTAMGMIPGLQQSLQQGEFPGVNVGAQQSECLFSCLSFFPLSYLSYFSLSCSVVLPLPSFLNQ